MDFKSILEGFAKIGLPILGAALPVPGGAALGTMLSSMIGSDSAKPEDILVKLTQDATALEKAKEFEETHQETMVKLALDAEQSRYASEVADRSSARTMQQSTQSWVPPLLAGGLTLGYFGILALKLMGNIGATDVVVNDLLTTLRDGVMLAWAFYFGSSKGSQDKNVLLHQSTPVNSGN